MFKLKTKFAALIITSLFLNLGLGIAAVSAAGEAPSESESVSTSGNGTVKGCGVADITDKTFSYQSFIISAAKDAGILSSTDDTDSPESATSSQSAEENFIAGARIVELSESLPGTDSVVGGSFLINAYKGICCTASKGDEGPKQCTDYAYVYTESPSACAKHSEEDDCRPIQLLVSTSGINLLKFYVLQVYVWGASIVGIIAVLVIVVSGIQIAVSGGEEQLTSARTRIIQSLSGLALLFLSGLILYTINPTFFTNT